VTIFVNKAFCFLLCLVSSLLWISKNRSYDQIFFPKGLYWFTFTLCFHHVFLFFRCLLTANYFCALLQKPNDKSKPLKLFIPVGKRIRWSQSLHCSSIVKSVWPCESNQWGWGKFGCHSLECGKKKKKISTLSNLVIEFCLLRRWHETTVTWNNHQRVVRAGQERLGLSRWSAGFGKQASYQGTVAVLHQLQGHLATPSK
jgi:hypothetical protein